MVPAILLCILLEPLGIDDLDISRKSHIEPADDYQYAEELWNDTKEKISNGDYEHFIRSSENPVCHIRPKGNDSKDLMTTPQGTREKKKCYWLNRKYVLSEIINL